MKVRTKTLLITVVSIVILIAVFFSACYVILVQNFQNIESNEAKLMAEKASQVINSDMDGLEASAKVFAYWNQTYDYAMGENPGFIESSLHDSTFENLDINVMIILDKDLDVIYRLAYDNGELPLPRGFYDHLTNTSILITNDYSARGVKGIIMVKEVAYEIAALPILRNDQSGPSAGILIMCRYVDDHLVSFIEGQISTPVIIGNHVGGDGYDDQVVTSILNDDNISAMKTLRDIYGNKALDVTVVMPREISQNAMSSQWMLLYLLLILAVGLMFSTLFALNHFVLRKLDQLDRDVRSIERHGDPNGRVEGMGDDELGNLATSINNMLDAVQRSESKLTESERRFKAVVQDQTEIIYRTTMDGEIAFANDQFVNFFGIDPTTLVGMRFTPVSGEDYEVILKTMMSKISREEPMFDFEHGGTRQDGESRFLHWSVRGVFDDEGALREYQWVGRDVTERMRLVEKLNQSERIESLGVLAGGIAHDFNNMLTSIMGTLAVVKRGMDPSDTRFRRLEEGERSIIKATELTKQLLTFSKGGEPIKHVINVPRFVKEAAEFSSHGTGVRLEFHMEKVWNVDGDEGQLFQVISNLVINARQAMPSGGMIKIYVSNNVVDQDSDMPVPLGRYVEILVSDNGIGIPKENLGRIFDPYFTTKRDGTGLGLTIVHSVVLRHSGYIDVKSVVGEGSDFRIFLPASDRHEELTVEETLDGEDTGGRVLVMDDEESILDVATDLLTEYGFEVQTASNGEDAIEMVRRSIADGERFDVLIMDLTIKGGMGGIEAIKEIRKIYPTVKAIVSSGYSNDPAMANPNEYGFDDVVQKPYQIEVMVRTLRRLVLEQRNRA